MSNINSQNNTSNTSLLTLASRIWQHSQQIIKGFGLVTLGIVGYSFFNPTARLKEKTTKDESFSNQYTDLIKSDNELLKQQSVLSQTHRATDTASFLLPHQNQKNLQEAVLFELNINYPENKPVNKIVLNNSYKHLAEKISAKRDVTTQIPIGIEFNVNDVTIYRQQSPAIVALDDGFVVGWSSEGQDGSADGVYIKKFDNNSKNLTSEVQANTESYLIQKAITLSSMGNSLLAGWQSSVEGSRYDIKVQWFNNLLEKLEGELPINDFHPYISSSPNAACSIIQNECTVVWYSLTGGTFDYDAIGQRLGNFTKKGTNFKLNNPNGEAQVEVSATYLNNNNTAYVYSSYLQDSSGWAIIGRTYDVKTATLSGETVLNFYTIGNQQSPIIANMPNSKVFFGWISNHQDIDAYDSYGRVFSSTLTPLTSDVLINTYTVSYQQATSAIYLSKKINALAVVWQSYNQDGFNYGVYGQLFTENLTKIGREFRINSYTFEGQLNAKIAELSNGNLGIVWESYGQDGSGFGIFGRILIPDITLFAYNLDIPKVYTEDASFQFSDLIVNPMLDADTINATLTLSNPSAGSLSLESSNNITASFDNTQGVWRVQNAGIVDLNRIFEQLKFIPSQNFNSDFAIQVDLTDSNTNHAAYSNSLTMLGVPVNDISLLTANQLAVNQGDTITLGLNNINAIDVDNALTDLSFKIDQLVQGQFENTNNPGRGITSFTFSQLANSEIRFIHDNTRFAPAYQISVNDGNLTTSPQPATIDFNARPELLNNQLNIESGQTVILTQVNLKASDDHTVEGKLMFVLSEITYGQFELVSAKGLAVTQFTQQQLIDSEVQFVHDASNQAPSFKTSVNDGRISSNPTAVTVNFVASNNLSAEDTLPLALGVSIGGAVLLAGAGIGIWQGRKQQQLKREREQEPLANTVRTKLRVGNVDDFKSSQGRTYVNFINTLKNELINLGIETEQMLPDEINELAGFISNAIKETMKENGIKIKKTLTGAIELNTQTLQTYATTIATKAQEFKNEQLGLSHRDVALKTLNPVNAV